MSRGSIHPSGRQAGWNVRFVATSDQRTFAGVYQHINNGFLTFKDALHELQLCFDLNTGTCHSDYVAFGLASLSNIDASEPVFSSIPDFVDHNRHSMALPAVSPAAVLSSHQRRFVKYHVLTHRGCELPADAKLASHLQAGCAQHIPTPTRRHDPRYLPVKHTPAGHETPHFPTRRLAKLKKQSGSFSPAKESGTESDIMDESPGNLSEVIPPEGIMSPKRARQIMRAFREQCFDESLVCAISSKGRSWVEAGIGPALEACHIIPQQHYFLYPESSDNNNAIQLWSPRRHQEAWERTWGPGNGIILLSHLHTLFDLRLLSIHPVTNQVRIFVPYDVISDYHGCKATLSLEVDRAALRHHYEMCCIENMACTMPWVRQASTNTSYSSGLQSPLRNHPQLRDLMLENEQTSEKGHEHQGSSKRAHTVEGPSDDQNLTQLMDGQSKSLIVDARPSASIRTSDSANLSKIIGLNYYLQQAVTSDQFSHGQDIYSPQNNRKHDSYITPSNHRNFLADVDWELHKVLQQRKILEGSLD